MKPIYSGKVREIYDVSENHLVIVTTDRISAFDNILPVMIRNKGVVLNRLSNFWFDMTSDIIPNHINEDKIENMPPFFHDEYFRNRTVMVKKLNMLPFEFVVRGYIFGSMWTAYCNGEEFCGNKIWGKYREAQKLESPILTPAIKRDKGHDEYVKLSVVESQLGRDLTTRIADYEIRASPQSYDKQLLRDWLVANKVNGKMQFDKVPESVLLQTEQIYQECLHRIAD